MSIFKKIKLKLASMKRKQRIDSLSQPEKVELKNIRTLLDLSFGILEKFPLIISLNKNWFIFFYKFFYLIA
jgi:hypothetical protein